MSAAAAATDATDAPKKKGSKKLMLIIGGVVLVLALGGGAAFYMMQKRAAEAAAAAAAEEEGDEAPKAKDSHGKKDGHAAAPTFLPLDPFVVNLADREQERFAQIGVTLQVDDAKVADQLKLYMPAIRNGVLLVLSQKTSTELLERAGKEKLASEIMREAVRPLGIEIEDEEAHQEEAATDKPAKKKKKKKAAEHNPVESVHFSSFIIQ